MVGKLLTNIFQHAVKTKTPLNIDEVFHPVEHVLYDTGKLIYYLFFI